jgi:multidrug efflux pump subunit AcrB
VFSRFFIDRPIFASVMSIVIALTGLVAIPTLPVAQYPQITPPSIIVQCNYPGADAKVVAESVAAPIEQQVNGVEDMIYMSSQSANDGSYTLSVTFKPGVNLNFAQVLVQNRVNLALPLLPDVVKQTGVTTRKRNPDILLIVSLYSERDPETGEPYYNQLYLSNYATLQIADELRRVDGVGDVFLFGQQDYSMRVWVDPDRLASLNLTAGDVANAIREQNQPVAAGQTAQPPGLEPTPFEYPITTLGRLEEPEQFADIVLRTSSDGRKVYIKDIGHVDLGPRNQDVSSKIDGNPCTSLAVFQLPYANALDTADNVRQKMDELQKTFPEHIRFATAFDTTPVISESIKGVYRSLGEAIALVALVVLIFLQNWRSTLIPLTAVPVAIIGTFAAMAAFGFSLNNLTLFGMVLAIGIVVDDAIVVVEAVEHHIEEGMTPRHAAYKAMEEVSGPVMAVALVLSAVFIPCAFISGITGQFFRQFALTIAVSTIISAFNSLTLSPALAAILLKPKKLGSYEVLPWPIYMLLGGALGYFAVWRGLGAHLSFVENVLPSGASASARATAPWVAALAAAIAAGLLARGLNRLLGWFFRVFNWSFGRATNLYLRLVGLGLRVSVMVLAVYAGLMLLTWWDFTHLPTGYIPNQDQRRLYAAVQLPDSASLERTQEVVDRIARIAVGDPELGGKHQGSSLKPESKLYPGVPGCAHTISVAGQSFTLSANGSNFGNLFITLDAFEDPNGSKRTADEVAADLQEQVNKEIPEAIVKVLGPPPVAGLGSTGGFKYIVEDRSGDNDLNKLEKQTNRLIAASRPKAAELPVTKAAVKWPPEEHDVTKADAKAGPRATVEWLVGQIVWGLSQYAGIGYSPDVVSRYTLSLLVCCEWVAQWERAQAQLRDIVRAREAPNGIAAEVASVKRESVGDGNEVCKAKDGSDATAEKKTDGGGAPKVAGLFTVFRANTPQLYVNLNRDQCQTMGVNPNDVFTTLQVYLGSLYVNDFNKFGRTWQVVVQAEAPFRNNVEAVKRLQVRNAAGNMVPLGAMLNVEEKEGPILLMRYNMYPAAAVVGNTAEGVSSGDGIQAMERLAKETLPNSMGAEWTEINYIQVDASKNIWNNLIFPLAVVFVFLVLAAQYESWALPMAVILVVPMCILGSLTGVKVTHSDINIFTQIGFVVLVGLASKNAILIVEFAKHKHEAGLPRREATLAACRLRLRPILMTSFAFILGVVPLMLATGAGAEMRRTLGTAVFSGMLGVTLFGIFLTPVFFNVIEWVVEKPFFASHEARLAGRVLVHVVGGLTLGVFWLIPWLLGMLTRRPAPAAKGEARRSRGAEAVRDGDHAAGETQRRSPQADGDRAAGEGDRERAKGR